MPSNKRVIIVHRWGGSPTADWYPWLKRELEHRGISVVVPAMPTPDAPEITSWVTTLQNVIGTPDKNTYLVGHSMGCQTILRYLEQLRTGSIGGTVLVAGFFTLIPSSLTTPKEKKIARPWLETPINNEKVKERVEKIVAIFSDNDPFVPLEENRHSFEKGYGAKTITKNAKGHYDEDSKTYNLPIALKEVLKMAGVEE